MKIIPFRRGVLADGGCEVEVEAGREVSCDLEKDRINHFMEM